MKKYRMVLYVIVFLVVIFAIGFVLHQRKKPEGTQIVVLSTTDMHGRCWEHDILTDASTPNNMLRVSTAVKDIRSSFGNENVILIDNGDLIQGTAVSEVHLLQEAASGNESEAMALCLKEIGYDVFSLGNHEFNFPWITMNRIYEDLRKGGVSVVSANIFYDGKDGFHEPGETVFEPYVIREVQVNGNPHRIGIFGLENSDISRWDLPENYPGMMFTSADNPEYDLSLEANRTIAALKEEGCEMIILSYHGSMGNDEGLLVFGDNTENQGHRIVKNTDGLDLLIAGHDHVAGYSGTLEKDGAGRDVCVVNGGGEDLTKTVFQLSEDEHGALLVTRVSTENLALSDYEPDMELGKKIQPYAELADQKMDEPIGAFAGEWDESDNYWLSQNDTEDFVRAVMIDTGTRKMNQKFEASELEALNLTRGLDHLDVDAAVTSVLNSGYVVKAGEVTTRDVYRMVRFSDYLLVLPIYGRDLKAIMEENASERLNVRVLNQEPVFLTKNDLKTYLIFGGINFSYDMAKPAGERVIIDGFSNGRSFEMDEVYLIAVNNYQLNNEAGLLRNYSEADALWTQKDDTAEDSIQRSIIRYIERRHMENQSITPNVINWKWEMRFSDDPKQLNASNERVIATLADQPVEGHRYLIYSEAQECTISLVPEQSVFKTTEMSASGNHLVGELPSDAMILTAHFQDEDSLAFTDPAGRLLTCGAHGGLFLKEAPEEDDRTIWQIIPVANGYHLKAEGEGNEQFLEYYENTITTYKQYADSSYLFNFYELKDAD